MNDSDEPPSPEEFRGFLSELFGAFAPGELKLLLSKFEPLNAAQKVETVLTLLELRHRAAVHRERADLADQILKGKSSTTFEDHRVRMGAIASHAKRLHGLLIQEPFFSALLYYPTDDGPPTKEQWRKIIFDRRKDEGDRLMDGLVLVSTWASLLHEHPGILREMRSALAGTEGESRKSFERTWIWEPVFDLWLTCGKRLGASRSGKLHDVLKIMHRALRLEEPNPETVYRAIRDFKKERGSSPRVWPATSQGK